MKITVKAMCSKETFSFSAETIEDLIDIIAKKEICKVFGLKKCPSKMVCDFIEMRMKMTTQLVQEPSDEEIVLSSIERRPDTHGEDVKFASSLRRGAKMLAIHG